MRRVLVTGGAGFIGAHLVRALLARGDATRVLDNFVTGTAANLALALGLDRAAVERALAACAGVEVVFHQAALRSVPRSMAHPLETNEVNATGTLQVLQQARAAGVRRVVSASSSAVYGDTELPKHEGQVPPPKAPYA